MSSSSATRSGGRGSSAAASATNTVLSAVTSAITTASGKGHGGSATTSSAAAATSTAAGRNNNNNNGNSAKSMQQYWFTYYPLFQWWLVAAALGVVMLMYIASLTRAYYRRRQARTSGTATSDAEPKDGEIVEGGREGTVSWRNLPAAVSTVWNKFVYRFTIPTSLDRTQRMNLGEAFFCLWYVLASLVLGFSVVSSGASVTAWGDLTGYLAYAQTPFIVGLAGKNNVVSYITGISPEKLNVMHRTGGRTMLIMSLAHTFAWVSVGVGPGSHHSITSPDMIWGTVAVVALFGTYLLSFRFIRRLAYEFFLVSHIVLICFFLAGCILHEKRAAYWIYPSFALWATDRLVRVIRLVLLNRLWLSAVPSSRKTYTRATIQAVSDYTIRISMTRKMGWRAGQHVYLLVPGVSVMPWEAHPFTVASAPKAKAMRTDTEDKSENELTFLVRARDGFTKRLMARAVSGGGESSVMAFVDGPYGISPDLFQYSSVVLIAGGSGISYTLSQLSSIIQYHATTPSAIKRVSFVWIIRQTAHLSWVDESLVNLLSMVPSGLEVGVKIYVTHTISIPSTMPILTGEPTEKPDLAKKDSSSSVKSDLSSDDVSGVASLDNQLVRFPQVKMLDGRPNIPVLLKEEVDAARGPVSVSVCGPTGLARTVRSALTKKEIASWSGAMRGRPEVELHVEQFGW